MTRVPAEELHRMLRDADRRDRGTSTERAGARSLIGCLRSVNLPSTMFLAGSEFLRVRRLLSWIRDEFFPSGTVVSSFHGAELCGGGTLDVLIMDLQSASLFAPEQLVIIYDFDRVSARALKKLIPALAKKSPTCATLVTVSGAERIPRELCSSVVCVEFETLSGASLERWILKEARREGVRGGIDPEGVKLLAATFGGDLTSLSQEIAKLSLLVRPDEEIPFSLVQSLVSRSPERTAFQLVAAMASGELKRAVRLAADLLEQGQHPLQLSTFLSRCFRTMLAEKDLSASRGVRHRRQSSSGESEKGGARSELSNPWLIRNLSPGVQAFTAEDLRRSLELLTNLDLELKSSGIPGPFAISLFVQRVALRSFPYGAAAR